MTESLAWLNGGFLPDAECRLPVHDLGVVGGVALTEMIRTFHHRPFQLEAHLDRLEWGLKHTGITPTVSRTELIGIVNRLVTENAANLSANDELLIIIFVTAGNNLTYLGPEQMDLVRRPTVGVHTVPMPFALWRTKFTAGQALVTVPGIVQPVDWIDPRLKSRSRFPWWLADQAARKVDPQALAFLQDSTGHLTETSTGNLCVVRGTTIHTPRAERVLGGISLQVVRELCESLGWSFTEADISLDEALRADELWLTSTPLCVVPVTTVNGQPIGSGQPGPHYRQLLAKWNELVGLDIAGQMQTT